MVEAVTEVLVARRGQPERFNTMLAWSLAAHVGIVAVILLGGFDFGIEARTEMFAHQTQPQPL